MVIILRTGEGGPTLDVTPRTAVYYCSIYVLCFYLGSGVCK